MFFILFEFLFEIVLLVLAELPWDRFVRLREADEDHAYRKLQWAMVSLLVGVLVGMISLFIAPNSPIKSTELRVAYLILAPPLSAWVSFVLSRRFARKGFSWVQPNLHALCAFSFALALTVIRFAYARRSAG